MIPRLLLVFALCLVAVTALSGCSLFEKQQGRAIPVMSFEHIAPYPVNVGHIEIRDEYSGRQDPHDIAGRFPTPPVAALREYASSRLQPKPGIYHDTLHFVIEDAHIYQYVEDGGNGFSKWFGFGVSDVYDLKIKLRLYSDSPVSGQSSHSVLTFTRAISIPRRYSLAERDLALFTFIENMMKDVDTHVIATLSEKMALALAAAPSVSFRAPPPSLPVAKLLDTRKAEHIRLAMAVNNGKMPVRGLSVQKLLDTPEIRWR